MRRLVDGGSGIGARRGMSGLVTGSRVWGGVYVVLAGICTAGLLSSGPTGRGPGVLMLVACGIGALRGIALRVDVHRGAVVARQWVGVRVVPVTPTLCVRTAPYAGGFYAGPGRSGVFWVVELVDGGRVTPLPVTLTTRGSAIRKAARLDARVAALRAAPDEDLRDRRTESGSASPEGRTQIA